MISKQPLSSLHNICSPLASNETFEASRAIPRILEGKTKMKTDLELQKDVMDEISWEPSVCSPDVRVTVHKQVVNLTGSVDNLPAKLAAGEAALRVLCVKSVTNEIEVRLPTDSRRSDPEIAMAASNALEWNTISPKNLQVMVEDGWAGSRSPEKYTGSFRKRPRRKQ
jgi:osmotically-inducible protein OsmY